MARVWSEMRWTRRKEAGFVAGREEIRERKKDSSCFARWVLPDVGYPVKIMSWRRQSSSLESRWCTHWHCCCIGVGCSRFLGGGWESVGFHADPILKHFHLSSQGVKFVAFKSLISEATSPSPRRPRTLFLTFLVGLLNFYCLTLRASSSAPFLLHLQPLIHSSFFVRPVLCRVELRCTLNPLCRLVKRERDIPASYVAWGITSKYQACPSNYYYKCKCYGPAQDRAAVVSNGNPYKSLFSLNAGPCGAGLL